MVGALANVNRKNGSLERGGTNSHCKCPRSALEAVRTTRHSLTTSYGVSYPKMCAPDGFTHSLYFVVTEEPSVKVVTSSALLTNKGCPWESKSK